MLLHPLLYLLAGNMGSESIATGLLEAWNPSTSQFETRVCVVGQAFIHTGPFRIIRRVEDSYDLSSTIGWVSE